MHLSSKNQQNHITANSVLTMLKNASFLPENATTLGGSGPGKETREPEANTGSAKTAMKGSLKIIGTWRSSGGG